MDAALLDLKAGRVAEPPTIPTFAELQEVVGFPRYYEEESKYASTPEK